MSELINSRDTRATIRWKLLTGASALALTAYVSSGGVTKAEDAARPILWFELGGQFDVLTAPAEIWTPANLPPVIDHPVTGILSQKPRIGYDMNGAVTFQPEGSDWSLSAAIQFGKAKRGPRFAHDQTYQTKVCLGNYHCLTTYAFTSLHSVEETKHLILDFQAGKDVGLGLFGHHGDSTVKIGARYAQFRERADGMMTAATGVPKKYNGPYTGYFLNAYMHSQRSFTGIGPSIAWNGSVPIAGSLEDGLAFDWGANAALLFGRQRTKVRTHTEDKEADGHITIYTPSHLAYFYSPQFADKSNVPHTFVRNKRVTVPNLGGFAGLSYRLGGEAKIAIGYKADFFFGAIDGGIDTAKKENRGFYGPFASISIGIGD